MPNYVCPECGESAIDRCVVIEGTLMHYSCHLKLKALTTLRPSARRRAEAFRERAAS